MAEPNPKSGMTPTELMDNVLSCVTNVEAASDPPGNEWNFALGALFALCNMGHFDQETIGKYEARIQAEANRIHAASK